MYVTTCKIAGSDLSQWAHYVASTSIQRRYDVATGYRRCIDVEAT